MIDFIKARNEALKHVQETELVNKLKPETVHRLSKIRKTDPKLCRFTEVWSITTEICLNNIFFPIDFYMGIPADFPLILPKIYLQKPDRDKLGYLPHVDNDGFVCLYDDENIQIDWSEPGLIAKNCIVKAREIIENGLLGNNHADFDEEFVAYWEQKYGTSDSIQTELCIINDSSLFSSGYIDITVIKPSYLGYKLIIHDNSDAYCTFKSFLLKRQYKLTNEKAFYAGDYDQILPYNQNFRSA